ncbi:hypothetical protein [Amphiplicatus metriothermophilus]|uniref:hypothetical protein n=1 Tax=Amphiplicatus metriothermophilus TaxID=1519374 RepID=UPI001177ED70|nr:hypothetical protein [Amphiplicatus metriothermophilus]MBB5517579.1 hypothetical protein [Amphiplicatus metriothermophilus]
MELLLLIVALLLAAILITLLHAWGVVWGVALWAFMALVALVLAGAVIGFVGWPFVAIASWFETEKGQRFYKRWLRVPGLIVAGSIMTTVALIILSICIIDPVILSDPILAIICLGTSIGLGACAFRAFGSINKQA